MNRCQISKKLLMSCFDECVAEDDEGNGGWWGSQFSSIRIAIVKLRTNKVFELYNVSASSLSIHDSKGHKKNLLFRTERFWVNVY